MILMNDAMDALYLYAQENTFRLFLAQTEGYSIYREDEYTKRLRALLDEPGQKLLDDLLRTETSITGLESESAFQAGFHTAFDLFR